MALKNKNLFKRGGYAVAAIALAIAGVIVLNVLMGALSKRVNLEYDMTAEKKNTVSQENIDYIRSVDKDVTIYVLAASPEDYTGGYLEYYTEQQMHAAKTTEYYKQTVRFLEQYEELNSHIKVRYIDPYGTEMADITQKFGTSFSYGDLIVYSSFKTDSGAQQENHKSLTFTDIYNYEDSSGNAQYGMDYYYLSGSKLETALTSAIANVTSEDVRKLAFLAGHSDEKAFSYLRTLLSLNNFTVEDISDTRITSISSEYDGVILCKPSSDFLPDELDALDAFLENDGKKGKSFFYYADSHYQNLTNFNAFLEEWGISVQQGIVFETNDSFHTRNSYSTLFSSAKDGDLSFLSGSQFFLSGYNVPMTESGTGYGGRETQTVLSTSATAVAAPLDTPEDTDVSGNGLEKKEYSTCILSRDAAYLDNNLVCSYVIAYSSIDFISESYVRGYASYCDYKSLALSGVRHATGANQTSITFDEKTISSTTNVYLTNSVGATVMLILFVVAIPVLLIGLGIFVVIRRRNR